MGGNLFTILLVAYTVFGVMLYDLDLFTSIDELFAFGIAACAVYSITFNKAPNAKPLIIWLCIDAFYLAYSLFIRSNAYIAIANDFIMQSKPFMTFFGMMCLQPRLTQRHFDFIALFAAACAMILPFIYILHPEISEGTFKGVPLSGARFGSAATQLALLFYLGYLRNSGGAKTVAIFIMLIGLLAPTSKYLGMVLCTLVVLPFVNQPVRFNFKYITAGLCLLLFMLFVVWDDIAFYMLRDKDEETARFMLYSMMPQILVDYFPAGSGFATFANAASATWYSSLYSQYNLDIVFGLTEGDASFVSDVYYPTLAQYGLIGVGLFIWFIYYLLNLLKRSYQEIRDIKRYRVGLLAIAYILIESTSDASLIGNRGVLTMVILALTLYKYTPAPQRVYVDTFGLKNIVLKKSAQKTAETNEDTDN